ncbi:ATP-dependent DNA ligase [Undibacterium pigrum]|uniref:DNA ligase (ATP) n=1 Tax=Undibacterium pigrum TaxID=401470 RepID=A0A318JGW9_9BURK|nr:ATP-dependent DNA ligase [Undibacterium pigrum]PXX47747.1 DNA ligase-1 [Undibacterium pigrum]
MREFAQLYAQLDETTSTNRKLDALKTYFSQSPPEDAAWAVYFLAGGKPRQAVPSKLLRQFAMEYANIEEWLFEECYQAVGDLSETIAHVLPPPVRQAHVGLANWMLERIAPLRGATPEVIRSALFSFWDELATPERFLLGKLIGGGFRVGVSKLLVTRALGDVAKVDNKLIAQRLMGWTDGRVAPTADGFMKLIRPQSDQEHSLRGGQPYPFFLAHQLSAAPESLGDITDWQAEWKYDGIRAQLLRRDNQTYLWSRGEDLITERFPEIATVPLPNGTAIDGEILVWTEDRPAPFADLQKRIGRKSLTTKLLSELPAVLVAYDLLELEQADLRHLPQHERRALLEKLVASIDNPMLRISPVLQKPDWQDLAMLRQNSRALGVEGMMLKAVNAQYGVGRTKDVGTWWKWKIDPYSIDAVLIYAQSGHGRRASLYTDYTFAVWDEDTSGKRLLVPFAKAYSGLTDAEIAQVDAVIRKTTIEKFGPARSVKPSMVFEIGFEGISLSTRHKAGIAVRFPRILRRREDKQIEEANTLDDLKNLLASKAHELGN